MDHDEDAGLAVDASDDGLPTVPTTHQALLDVLEEVGRACSLKELALRTGRHTSTVREYLADLSAWGRVTSRLATPSGRGRPARLYSLAGPGSHRLPDMTTALALEVAALAPDPAAVGARIGRTLARGSVGHPDELVAALNRAGYDPEPVEAEVEAVAGVGTEGVGVLDAGVEVRLHHCPYLDTARVVPDLMCPLHAGMVSAWTAGGPLGELAVDLVPNLAREEGPCVLRLRPRP